MRYAFYPGCSLESTAHEYETSLKVVGEQVDVEFVQPRGWICCGSSAAHATSRLLATALPLKNLALVRQAGFDEVVVPCAACFSRFRTAQHECAAEPAFAQKAWEAAGVEPVNNVKVSHPLELFNIGEPSKAVQRQVKKDLSKLKVVCYYGCLLTRPAKVMQFDNCEYPMLMDTLLRSVGVPTLDWSYKTDCCGAALALTRTDVVLRLVKDLLKNALAVGAEALAVACPLCHANLDMRQTQVNQKFQTTFALPIFYFTQLMGLALGLEPKALGLQKHLVNPMALVDKL
ncbi:MAG: heterodisulfide reductase subunit B [Planctomycetes bacterium]|nr:heterodisulfide reductase subunit B [Planctomycetota bacterium]